MEERSQARMPCGAAIIQHSLESLSREIKRNRNIKGAYLRTLEPIVRFTVRAYADDVVFISKHRDGILRILQILESFVHWSRIELNAGKYAKASYVLDDERIGSYLDNAFTVRGEEIPSLTAAQSLRYLGAPIAARRTAKLKSTKFKVKEMENLLEKIISSPLLIAHKIDTMKTFLLPSINFLLLKGEVGINQLKNMGNNIRGMVHRELKMRELPIQCHHASWRDGGLSYPRLQDREEVRKIRSFGQMTRSGNVHVLDVIRQFIEDKRRYRKIVQCSNA
jgi:hypothetical protein